MKFFLATLYIAILGISACEDMGDPVSPPSTSAPSITSIIPDSGNVGDTVRIVGKNFTSTTGSVKFGTLSADVIVSWSDTLLRVKVPAGAATGNVLVTAGSKNSNGKQFRVIGTVAQISFANDIRPLITTYGCAGCHPGNGGFSVATHATIVTRVTVGNGDGSLLVQKLRGTAPGARMPNGGPNFMTTTEIQKFVDWINQGALDN